MESDKTKISLRPHLGNLTKKFHFGSNWLLRQLQIQQFTLIALLLVLFMGGITQCNLNTSKLSPHDWITVNKDLTSQRFVDLDQINPSNVTDLTEICEIDLNEPSWFSSGILKIGNVLYFTTRRITFAIDATNCEKIWRYVNTELPFAATTNNRGLAYLPGTGNQPNLLFRGTASGHLLALNAANGEVVWDIPATNPTRLESIVAAPVAGKGKVYVGISTADLGVCGRVMAFDAYTGQELWRHYNVPVKTQSGEVICDEYAGGAQWTSLTLDIERNELYVPVSNPNPDYTDTGRPGPNLQTNSVLVFNTETTNPNGELLGLYQAVPSDIHDWDLGTAPVLYSIPGKNGAADRDMLAVAGKDGFVYGLERKHISPNSINLDPIYTTQGTDTANFDAPFPLNKTYPPNDTVVRVSPGSIGGAQFTGPSYDPINGALYVGMNHFPWFYFNYDGPTMSGSHANQLTATDFTPITVDSFPDETYEIAGHTQPDLSLGKPPTGRVTAFNQSTGDTLWTFEAPAQVQAGTVPTKGGLLFVGDTYGNLFALDSKTGKLLHKIETGGAINSGLISYEVGSEQFVAAGVGGLSLNVPGITQPLRPEATLRLKIFGLKDANFKSKKVASWPRVPITNPKLLVSPAEKGLILYGSVCQPCHGHNGRGAAYPSLQLQYHILTDSARLTSFFDSVPPPMPKLYPGLLKDEEIGYLTAYFKSLPEDIFPPQGPYTQPTSTGEASWPAIYSVLTHPRCINCHTSTNYPRQTDERHPHIYGVTRGAQTGPMANKGSAIRRCLDCHGTENNDFTGVPGTNVNGVANWQLAPLDFGWEIVSDTLPNTALPGNELCKLIKNYAKKHTPDSLVNHLYTDLVEWAFDPGQDVYGLPRTKPPLTHPEFIDSVKNWISEGMPCPECSDCPSE